MYYVYCGCCNVITTSKVFETGSWECAQGKQYYNIYNTLIIIILTGRDATNQTVIHRVNCSPRAAVYLCVVIILLVYPYRGCGKYLYIYNNIIYYVPCRCVTQPFFFFSFSIFFPPVYRVLFSRHIVVRTHESHPFFLSNSLAHTPTHT